MRGAREWSSGRLGNHRQIEHARAMRVGKDFAGKIGAAAAAVAATGATAKLGERPHAVVGGLADRALGDGVADAYVHAVI